MENTSKHRRGPILVVPNVFKEVDSDTILTTDEIDRFLHEESQRTERSAPDKSVWYWVLDTALRDYQTLLLMPKRKHQFGEIFDFFFNNADEREYFGSYHKICETLGIDPEYLLKKLIIWTKMNYRGRKIRTIQ